MEPLDVLCRAGSCLSRTKILPAGVRGGSRRRPPALPFSYCHRPHRADGPYGASGLCLRHRAHRPHGPCGGYRTCRGGRPHGPHRDGLFRKGDYL